MTTAGQKIVWLIDFHTPGHASKKPEISFVAKKNAIYLPPIRPMDAPMRDKAQEFLNKIQAMCNKITADCQKEAVTDMDYLKKSHLVSRELGDLDNLIKKLNDILRWFKPPEKPEEEG